MGLLGDVTLQKHPPFEETEHCELRLRDTHSLSSLQALPLPPEDIQNWPLESKV
jgi:hypothetical protein